MARSDTSAGQRVDAIVRLDGAEKVRLLAGVFRPGSRSVMFRFPDAGRLEDGDMFGAVIEEVAEQPEAGLHVHLWFWNDLARIYVIPGAHFEVWYARTVGKGLVLPWSAGTHEVRDRPHGVEPFRQDLSGSDS